VVALGCAGLATAAPASAKYDIACSGVSSDPGVFPDAGAAANCLKAYDIALGKSDGTFGENDALLRSQVSSLLARLLRLAGATFIERRSFSDVNPSTVPNAQVRDEIELLAGSRIIAGLPDGYFHPTDNLTVKQAATLVLRALALIRSQKPGAPNFGDQGSTDANYRYAVGQGLLDRDAKDVGGTTYPSEAGDTTHRGLLADMLAQVLQRLVDAGIVRNRAGTIVFGDGQYHVGSQLPAGTYRTTTTTRCYWERESGFGGTAREIIANDFASGGGPEIVTIDATDVGFKSDNCATWSNDLFARKAPADPIPPGMWQVGKEVTGGMMYHASPSGSSSCYWARLSGFGGTFREIIGNGISHADQIVRIDESDLGFMSSGCTNWTVST
jgi:hypothetical protein